MSKPSPKLVLRKNSKEWRVLNFLNEVVNFGLDVLLPLSYSYTMLWRVIFGLDEAKGNGISAEEQEHYKRLFSATLTRLQCKGYVIKEKNGNKFHWKLTEAGEAVWSAKNFTLPPEDGIARLFVFDIQKIRNFICYKRQINLDL